MAFLVACVGHDIDHRGTTNAFQSKAGTELASLYSSQGSVMERHHFQQTMCVLHLEDCNIFEHINKEQYSHCVEIINHEKAFNAFAKDDPAHRDLLFGAMVTCADFGMQTKDFHSICLTVALREVQRFWRHAAPVFARRLAAGQEALRILDDGGFEAEVLDLVARQTDITIIT
ncbi:cGMP-specific 3',5'-cyclic phosphodiesterase [Gryllus bimaculatus]|nr:cGMP-specific 3',5'-cyclic phosphodiesterase [Gryllus bimaculatus]